MIKDRTPRAMLSTSQSFGLFLNANLLMVLANLLLVLVTAGYVWLTWQTLRALQQASLREREARHLQEIKDNVIQPIVKWIRETVFERFTGKFPRLLVVVGGYSGKSWQVSHTVDDPFRARSRLATSVDLDIPDILATWDSLERGRISKFLYDHTEQEHFPRELREFDRLLEDVRQLTSAFTSLSNECAKGMANLGIPQASCPDDENSMSEWSNPYLLAAECVHSLLLGQRDPGLHRRSFQNSYVLTTADNQSVAKATEPEKLKHWCELGYDQMRARWEGSDLPQRVRDVLKNAESVRRNIEGLLFTHSLGVDCELVSGRKRYR
jgi:hypothetical protein